MVGQGVGCLRPRRAAEVLRARDRPEPRGAEAGGGEVLHVGRGADPERHVEALLDEIDLARGEDDGDLDLGVGAAVVGHEVGQEGLAEGVIGGDPERARHHVELGGGRMVRLVGQADDIGAAGRVGATDVGHHERPGGAAGQLDPQLLLEVGEPAAHGLLGDPEHPRGAADDASYFTGLARSLAESFVVQTAFTSDVDDFSAEFELRLELASDLCVAALTRRDGELTEALLAPMVEVACVGGLVDAYGWLGAPPLELACELEQVDGAVLGEYDVVACADGCAAGPLSRSVSGRSVGEGPTAAREDANSRRRGVQVWRARQSRSSTTAS